MTTSDTTTDLTEPATDVATLHSSVLQRLARRFITAEETAALLEVTEDVLRHWRVSGRGPSRC